MLLSLALSVHKNDSRNSWTQRLLFYGTWYRAVWYTSTMASEATVASNFTAKKPNLTVAYPRTSNLAEQSQVMSLNILPSSGTAYSSVSAKMSLCDVTWWRTQDAVCAAASPLMPPQGHCWYCYQLSVGWGVGRRVKNPDCWLSNPTQAVILIPNLIVPNQCAEIIYIYIYLTTCSQFRLAPNLPEGNYIYV